MGFTVAELERELLVDRLQNDNMRLEVEEARGSLGSLADRLDVSLNQDGTLRPSELNIGFVRDESSIISSAIDGAWLILDGNRSSVYVVDRRVRFNDNDALTGFVQSAVYDAETDETTITFQEAAGVVITAIGFSFNPNTVSKIHHSELADILPAVEGADDTKNKHVSNLQLLNKVPYAQGIRRVVDIDALRLLTPDLCTVVFMEYHTNPGDGGHGIFIYDATKIAVDDNGTEVLGWIRLLSGFVTPRMYGAQGDGTFYDTAAFLSAISYVEAHQPFVFDLGTGIYRLAMGQLVSRASRVKIIGNGLATKLLFEPTADDQIGWLFDEGDASAVQNILRDVSYYANDTTYRKIGFKFVNQSEMDVNNIRTAYPNFLGNGSIGVNICGRELHGMANLKIRADYPIVISPIPVEHPVYTSGFDHYNFHNCYLSANGGDIVTIESGVKVTNISFTGYQAWVLGRDGLRWVDTEAVVAPVAVVIENLRLEQTEDASGYLARIESNTPLQSLTLRNCRNGNRNSLYLRNVLNLTLENFEHTDAARVAMDVDATVKKINFINCFWQTGATASMVGQRLLWSTQKDAAGKPLPPNAIYGSTSDAVYDRIMDSYQTGNEITLAVDATYTIPGNLPICLMYMATDADYGALFTLQGVRNAVAVLHEDIDIFSNAKDTASRLNVYAEGGAYIIQNKRAVTTKIKLSFLGTGQTF